MSYQIRRTSDSNDEVRERDFPDHPAALQRARELAYAEQVDDGREFVTAHTDGYDLIYHDGERPDTVVQFRVEHQPAAEQGEG